MEIRLHKDCLSKFQSKANHPLTRKSTLMYRIMYMHT